MSVLELEQVGELLVVDEHGRREHAHVATASGIVAARERVYVVADDRPALAFFDALGAAGRLVALDERELPGAYSERKAAKPDLESLAILPATPAWPHGALLTLGSGSTERRERGWLVPVDSAGTPADPVEVSLTALYARLRDELPDLNIEGAAVHSGALWLAQRGNGVDGFNALVELDLTAALAALAAGAAPPADAVRGVSRWSLGEVDEVPLTFSDLAPAGELMLFCAVAEAGESTYDDGDCVGSGIGALDPRAHEVVWFSRLREPHKVEGISPARAGLLLVADPDTDERPAPLFSVASRNLPG